MTTGEFKTYYNKLNPAQKKAVDTIEGPVMVVAGPGTGKTQLLTLRIANILLQTQVNPENILALTFTESGVLAMRKRLVEIIGTPGYKAQIYTFHGFCNEVIKRFPEEFPNLISFEAVTEIDQIQIIEKIIQIAPLNLLKPFGDPFYYLKHILKAINELKKEGMTPEIFKNALQKQEKDFNNIKDLYHEKGSYVGQMKGKYADLKKEIEKNKELAPVFEQYQASLIKNKIYDFNDMLLSVVDVLRKNKFLLLYLQETYQYILVDEHQDTNTSQNKLIEILASFYDNPNLFVVGDEKQAIYRFQGASLENFLYFKSLYPQAELINLEENYRSTQTILDGAASLIRQNITTDILGKASLKSTKGFPEEKIKIVQFNDYYSEYFYIAQDLQEKIKKGVSPKEIAVLSRLNADLTPVISALENFGIEYSIESEQNIFQDPFIRKVIILLSAIESLESDLKLASVLHLDFLDLDPMDIFRLIHFASAENLLLCEVLEGKHLSRAKLKEPKKFLNVYKKLKVWKKISKNENLDQFFIKVLKQSGLLEEILKHKNRTEILDKFAGLFEEIKLQQSKKPNLSLPDFLNYLNLLEEHNILIKKPVRNSLKNAIRLMTVHRSKGQEFDYVYIINAYDKHWGNTKLQNRGFKIPWEYLGVKVDLNVKLEENEDERRLFYVALTRARKEAIITFSSCSVDGREQIPSQFISEIDESYKEELDTRIFEENFLKHKEIIFEIKKTKSKNLNREFFKDLFLEKGLSASSLANFLTCPWRYFYRNLLELPEPKNHSQTFGLAMHKALNIFIRNLNSKGKSDLDILLKGFKESLSENMRDDGMFYPRFLKRGEEALTGYFEQKAKYFKKPIFSEMEIRGIKLFDTVTLNGRLDMIMSTGNFNEVYVYDFKTGKYSGKSKILRKELEMGDYKRQLLFYKILLDNYYKGKFNMVKGVIEFIEPDNRGRYKSQEMNINPQEIDSLKSQIKFVAEQIIKLKFWDERCDDKKCEYCHLRSVMD